MSAEDSSIRQGTWPAPTGSPHDPFDAEHPDNMPAYRDHAYAVSVAIELDPSLTMSEWREILETVEVYPDEVGHDEETDRLHLPIGFDEWKRLRDHPCWPEYLDQMRSVPAGETVGFKTWMNLPAPGRSMSGGPAGPSPFLCDPFTTLPAGWVRGDSVSTDERRPYRQVAHDPTRHVVARCTDVLVSTALRDRLAAAGFQPLTTRDTGGPEVTYFVRDRAVDRRPVPIRQAAATGRGRAL